MKSSKKKPTAVRADEEMLRLASLIAESEGLDGFTATVRYCLFQVHKQIQKEGA